MGSNRIAGITIQLNGDTTGLSRSLESVNKTIKNTQSQLKDVQRLLKLDPANTELLAQKQHLLTEKITATKEKLDALNAAQNQVREQFENGDLGADKYEAFRREVIATEQELVNLAREAANANETLTKIDEAGKSLENIGNKITSVGSSLTENVTKPIVAVGKAAVETTANFDEGMSKVAAISGATGEDFDKLRDKAREMGAKTKFSASEAAEGFQYMAMAGWKTSDMLDGIEGIMNLAAASGEDLATTSDIVTDALTAFGLTAKDSAHFADILAAASSNSNTNVSMMGETFKYAAPIAGSLGYSAEDTALAIGLMANAGIKASQAGTSLRKMFTELTGDIEISGSQLGEVTIQTANADGTMRSLSEILTDCRIAFSQLTESEQASTAEALVGKTAMSGFLAVMNASEADVNKLSTAISNCDGVSQQMAETMQDNLPGQLAILRSALEELYIQIGDALMPTIRSIVSHVQDFVLWLQNLDEGTRNVIIHIGLFVAALGPALMIIGKVTSAVGAGLQAFASLGRGVLTFVNEAQLGVGIGGKLAAAIGGISAPVVGVVAAIGVLAAAFTHLWNTSEEFRNAITEIWDGIVTKISDFCQGIVDRLNELGFEFQDITEVLGAIWDSFCNILAPVFEGAFKVIAAVLGTVLDVLTGILDVFIGIFSGDWEQFWQGISGIFSGIWEGITGIFQAVLDTIVGILEAIFPGISEIWNSFWQGLADFFTGIWEGIANFFQGVWDTVTGVVTTAVNAIVTVISTAFEFIKGIFETIWNIITAIFGGAWDTITGTATSAVDIVTGVIQTAWNFVTGIFETVWNGISSFFGGIWNTISGVVSTVTGTISSVISTAWNTVSGIFDTVWSGISTFFGNIWDTMSGIVNTVTGTVSDVISTAWNSVSDTFDTVWSGISSFFGDVWDGITDVVSSGVDAVSSAVSTAWETVRNTFSDIWGGISGFFTGVWNTITGTVENKSTFIRDTVKKAFGDSSSYISDAMDKAKEKISGAMGEASRSTQNSLSAMTSSINTQMNSANSFIQTAVDQMKQKFNFSWSLPSFKLPHLSVSGSFSLDPPRVPSFNVSWYKKAMDNGMILNGATIFGMKGNQLLAGGEAGSETVVGTGSLMSMIKEAVSSMSNTETVNYGGVNINLYANENQDIRALADEIEYRINNNVLRRRAVFGT